jgi:hypothetical protein
MLPTEIPTPGSRMEWTPEAPAASQANQDMALLFYALLDDEDLKEVFGEFLVPAKPA